VNSESTALQRWGGCPHSCLLHTVRAGENLDSPPPLSLLTL
jgi:hypothetical protein